MTGADRSFTNRARGLAHQAATRLPDPILDRLRPLARRVGLAAPAGEWWRATTPPWESIGADPAAGGDSASRCCNVCGWRGDAFARGAHVEMANCPRCDSIGRDRFLLWCLTTRTPSVSGQRLLETSPRLGEHYREMMRRWFDYTASDYDERAHAADVRIDLQAIDLPDDSLDLVATPHVLEHVPDTQAALGELARVVRPGGRVYLLVPLLQGVTAPPQEPEFHGDDTPVFWRFGWDLTELLRDAGFEVDVLVPERFHELLSDPDRQLDDVGEFGLSTIVPHPRPDDLVVAADETTSEVLGFEPAFQFVVWECRRPA